MADADVTQLSSCATCHAWNGERSKIAFCPNSNEIQIWGKEGGAWEPVDTLTEHDQTVTSIDWAPKTNRIVSCSQDRNAYVWTEVDGGFWKPTLVILRINRAATEVKWSPNEDKFAVASGAKCVSVCNFEEDNDWWVSKHIKKHKSTVLSISWHPNNVLIATASSDFKVRVFSAFIKGDQKPGETPFGSRLPFGGDPLQEYTTNGWVQCVRWSPSGNQIAYCCQDSTFSVIDVSGGAPGVTHTVRLAGLPLLSLAWTSDKSVVGVGHGLNPILFENTGNWTLKRFLDEKKTADKSGASSNAFKMFQNKTNTGQSTDVQTLDTKHQNCITAVAIFGGTPQKVTAVSTTGLDGKLIIWRL